MPSADALPPEELIAGLFRADPARPVSGFEAPAFVARAADAAGAADAANEYLAIEVPPGTAPRALPLQALGNVAIPGIMLPLAHGAAQLPGRKPAYYVATPLPPGPSLATKHGAWPQEKLLRLVLRPVAAALEQLAARGVTHRSVRPDNLFQATPDAPVVLGPAWATPPASRQPALYEPPYVAQCVASGRGDGSIADDIYALGVVLAVLALGYDPLAGLEANEIVRRKLAIGSFAAIASDQRFPAELAVIVRAMLAEDPLQRPTPAQLLDPAFGRARRAPFQSTKRAAEPLVIGAEEAFLPRSLAHALASSPQQAIRLLRLGAVDHWVKRSLGDAALAQAVEQVVERRARDAAEGEEKADSLVLLRAVAVLDPLAPLVWNGISFWPDGLGPMLADNALLPPISAMIEGEAIGAWASCRAAREPTARFSSEARRLRALAQHGGFSGGMKRLAYVLNPLLPCRSALIGEQIAVTVPALLALLERAPPGSGNLPIDADIAAFLAARSATTVDTELARLTPAASASEKALATLRVYAGLQRSLRAGALPGLARMLAGEAAPFLRRWKERTRREALRERLSTLAEQGDLSAMLAVIEDPEARLRDKEGLKQAERSLQRIDNELAAIAAGGPLRAEKARGLGQEIATGLGLAALALTLVMMAFG